MYQINVPNQKSTTARCFAAEEGSFRRLRLVVAEPDGASRNLVGPCSVLPFTAKAGKDRTSFKNYKNPACHDVPA